MLRQPNLSAVTVHWHRVLPQFCASNVLSLLACAPRATCASLCTPIGIGPRVLLRDRCARSVMGEWDQFCCDRATDAAKKFLSGRFDLESIPSGFVLGLGLREEQTGF